ncbi:MAG TPA: ABC transporter permease subunit [Chthoniobacterales bacterium]|nr:ABC transporter permease subunit [Chthoniobacterales bacterium]
MANKEKGRLGFSAVVVHPYWILLPFFCGLLLVWQVASSKGVVDAGQWSSPTRIISTIVHDLLFSDGTPATQNSQPLWYHIGFTLGRFSLGFLIASIVGVLAGFTLGISRAVYSVGQPVVNFLRALPSAAVWPICALILGFNTKSQLIVICFGATWPILVNTMDAVRGLPIEVFDSLAFMRIGAVRRWLALCCWSAPGIFTGLEIGCAVAFLLTVTVEMIWVAEGGLGWYLIDHTQNVPDPERLLGGVFVVALLGWTINTLMRKLRNTLLFWEISERKIGRTFRVESAHSLLRKIKDRDVYPILTTDTVTETIQRLFASSAKPKVLYQDEAYMLPREASIHLKLGDDGAKVMQRDVIIPVDINDPESRVLLFARSWIRVDVMSPQSRAKLQEKSDTIGKIVRDCESAKRCSYRNLWYREQISDKLGVAFRAAGAIQAVQRARLILLDGKPAILIHEFVRL